MIVRYDMRSDISGTKRGYQCDSEEVKQIIKHAPSSLMWLRVYAKGRVYHWTKQDGWREIK